MANTAASVDGFQNMLFKATKMTVIFLTLIALLASAVSTFFLIRTFGNNFSAPIYSTQIVSDQSGQDLQIDTSAAAKVAVNIKYGNDILNLLNKNHLNTDVFTGPMIQDILNTPKDIQSSYIDSANKWMDSSANSGKTAEERIGAFSQAFKVLFQ